MGRSGLTGSVSSAIVLERIVRVSVRIESVEGASIAKAEREAELDPSEQVRIEDEVTVFEIALCDLRLISSRSTAIAYA